MTPGFLGRWHCHRYRSAAAGKVFAFSGDTVDCPVLRKLARGADMLAICCYAASGELTSPRLQMLARHTLACADTVGRIAAECGVHHLVLAHHRPRPDGAWQEGPLAEVSKDYTGPITLAVDELSMGF